MKKEDFLNVTDFRAINGNKIFSVEFIKKDGTVRKMRAMLGVKIHLKGGELSYNAEGKNYLIVWDLDKKGYRTINFNTLQHIKYLGIEEELQ